MAYEDFEAMKKITFGMVKTYVRKNEFLQYMKDHGIADPKLNMYDSTADLLQALEEGQIDAYIHTFTEVRQGHRLLGRFAPMPFYYITYQGNDDVLRELNQAIADLKISRPELETELMNRYYHSRLDKTVVFTTEEKTYIESQKEIVVGYLDGHYPFCYQVEGECQGIAREMFDAKLSYAGLNVQYKKYDQAKQAREALHAGEVDLLSYCTDTKEQLSEYGFQMIKEYIQIPLVIAMKEDSTLAEAQVLATLS